MKKLRIGLLCIGLMKSYVMFGAVQGVDSTQEKIDSLEKRIAKVEKLGKAISPYLPRVNGYIGIGYTYDKDVSTFDVRNARIDIKGDLPAKFGYRLLIDVYKFKIYDACIKYHPSQSLNFNLGQFKVPFSLGNVNGPLQEECIEYPLIIRKIVFNGMNGESTSGRDVGISMYGGFINKGKYNLFDYNIGVFNGNGMNAKDCNKSKDVSIRLEAHPFMETNISASYYWGQYGVSYSNISRWSAGASYKSKWGFLRGEYIYNRMSDIKSDGYYIVGGVNLPCQLTPLLRYESFTKDKILGDTEHDYTIGVSYLPFKFLRLQANYIRCNYADACEKSNSNQYKIVITGIL